MLFRSYPAATATLAARIAAEGAVLSEYAPGTPPAPFRFPERNRIVAEGAGAAPVAAALRHARAIGVRRLVCVVSGGNIDTPTLATILAGTTPS